MKYLKLFENKILDDILDKISTDGESSLTDWERKYLNSYEDLHTRTRMESEKEIQNNPPTEFVDPADNYIADDTAGIDETSLTDEVGELWDIIDDNEIDEFFDRFKMNPEKYASTRWDDLQKEVQLLFVTFLKQKGHIK